MLVRHLARLVTTLAVGHGLRRVRRRLDRSRPRSVRRARLGLELAELPFVQRLRDSQYTACVAAIAHLVRLGILDRVLPRMRRHLVLQLLPVTQLLLQLSMRAATGVAEIRKVEVGIEQDRKLAMSSLRAIVSAVPESGRYAP